MLYIPRKSDLLTQHNTGTVGNADIGTAVTTGASSSTKGSVAQLIASTSFDAYWITILAQGYGQGATIAEGCFDLLIGAATESVLIADLLMGYCGGSTSATGCGAKRWDFPLYIPAGSRLAAKAAGARTSTAIDVAVFLYGGQGYPMFPVGTKVTTYGMGTVPNGTSITPGASAAEGSWTQITASTTEDHIALVPSFQVANDATTNNRKLAVDLGYGAATEEEIMQSYWFETDSNERMGGPLNSMPCFKDIPSGSRLVMRASCDGTIDSAYSGVIHAVS